MSAWLMLRGAEGPALGTIEARDASDAAHRAFAMYGPPVTIADPTRHWRLALHAAAADVRADRAEAATMQEMGLG